jgi:hypothetical protein
MRLLQQSFGERRKKETEPVSWHFVALYKIWWEGKTGKIKLDGNVFLVDSKRTCDRHHTCSDIISRDL